MADGVDAAMEWHKPPRGDAAIDHRRRQSSIECLTPRDDAMLTRGEGAKGGIRPSTANLTAYMTVKFAVLGHGLDSGRRFVAKLAGFVAEWALDSLG